VTLNTSPWVICHACININLHIKLEVSSFNRSTDGAPKFKGGSHDHDYVPVRGSFSSVVWDLLWSTYVPMSLPPLVAKIGKVTQKVENGWLGVAESH